MKSNNCAQECDGVDSACRHFVAVLPFRPFLLRERVAA